MRLCDGRLVGVKNNLCLLVVYMQATKQQNKTRECSVAGDQLEPVICEKID
jgi:hypothetical protein